MTTSEKQKREYDLFGPWVLEIENLEDVPETFVSHASLTDETELAFKVPRRVERRNVRPGDDLYDFVVTLDGGGVAVFRRTSDGVTPESVPYNRIVAVETIHDLLYGEFTLITTEETIRVPFNTVSEDVIQQAVEIIRGYIRGESLDVPSPAVDLEEMIYLYRGLVRREQGYEPTEPVVYQPPRTVEKLEPTVLDRLLNIIKRPTLRAMVVLVSGHELILYRGEPPVTRFGRGNYGYSRTIVPRQFIENLSRNPDSVYTACEQLRIGIRGTELTVLVGADVDTARIDTALHVS